MNRQDALKLLKDFGRTGGLGAAPELAPQQGPPAPAPNAMTPAPLKPAPAVVFAPAPGPPSAANAGELAGQTVGPPGMGVPPTDVHQAGGELLARLQHPEFQTMEELYRILPEDSWFQPSVSPGNPIQFELGSFTVPNSQHYWLFDYEFSIFRFSGLDAGDILKSEAGRYSGVMGFDVTIDGRRPSHLLYQLDPQPAQLQRQTFISFNAQGGTNNNSAFNRSTAQSFAATASQGTSVLPVRRAMQGPEGMPFTFIARQQAKVSLSIIIFKRVLTPIAAVEGRHAGYLLQSSLAESLILRMRPR